MVAVSAGQGQPLRVELLGTVRAFRAGAELPIGPPRQRAVFAMLALAANRVVARDELIDGLWGADPPVSVVNRLHVMVGGLRRVLEPERTRRSAGQLLTLAGSGYRLQLPPGALDVQDFDARLRRARTCAAAADPAGAVAAFDAARALWRGPPLTGVPGPFAEVERARLVELGLSAAEARAAAMLQTGDLAAAIADPQAVRRRRGGRAGAGAAGRGGGGGTPAAPPGGPPLRGSGGRTEDPR